MKKELIGSMIISCALIALAWFTEFSPVYTVALCFFTAGIISYERDHIIIGPKRLKEQFELLQFELDLKSRIGLENDALREKVIHKDDELAAMTKAYANLLHELQTWEPNKQRGLFSNQSMHKLKEDYSKAIKEVLS